MLGETVGNYRLLRQIGEGGMGVVYLAEHVAIGKKAALKMLLPMYCRNESIVQRFFNEARATAKIQHPGLIGVYDFGHHTDGSAYIVMEFLEGESLAARIKRQGPIELPLVIELSRQLAVALEAAHALGIVHRDLKPDNVFLVESDELRCRLRAKVLDFGIAKLIDHASASQMKTRTGVLMGTPAYMSPEQCRGASRVDHRADIYSLGCMMFEMASGKGPFTTDGLGAVIAAHLYEPVPPLVVAPQLDPVVSRALAKNVDERYQTMGELLADLDALLMRRPLAPRPAPKVDAPEATIPDDYPAGAAAVARFRSTGRAGWLIGAALIALAGGGALLLRARRPIAATASTEATATTETTGGAPAAGSPARGFPLVAPAAADAAGRARIALTVESTPFGAQVFRAADGVRVGKTPCTLEFERGQGEAVFLLKLAGYHDATVTLPIDRDGNQNIVLTRATAATHRSGAVAKIAPTAAAPPTMTPALDSPEPELKLPPRGPEKVHRSLETGELHSPF